MSYLVTIFMICLTLISGCIPGRTVHNVEISYVPANQVPVRNLDKLTLDASNGNAIAQYELGNYYYDGIGIRKSHRNALEWWKKSAEQGYAPAQFYLGQLYFVGEGIFIDYVEGCKWLKAASDQGLAQASHQFRQRCI